MLQAQEIVVSKMVPGSQTEICLCQTDNSMTTVTACYKSKEKASRDEEEDKISSIPSYCTHFQLPPCLSAQGWSTPAERLIVSSN